MGIITELPFRLIELEPSITSALPEHTDAHKQRRTRSLARTLIVLLVFRREGTATASAGFGNTAGARQAGNQMLSPL